MLSKVIYLQLIRTCWRLAGPAGRPRMVFIYAIFGLANAVMLLRPAIIGKLVATLAAGGFDFWSNLSLWLGAMITSMLVFWTLNTVGRNQELRLAGILRQNLTLDLYSKLVALPWEWHGAHHSGDSLNRITVAGKALFFFTDNQFWYLQVYLRLGGSILALLVIAPAVGVTVALIVPPFYLVLRHLNAKAMAVSTASNERESHVAAGLLDYLGNIASVLTLNLGETSKRNLRERFERLRRAQVAGNRIGALTWFVLLVGTEAVSALALLTYLVTRPSLQGPILAGTIIAIFQYLQLISGCVQEFADTYQRLLQSGVDLAGTEEIEKSFSMLRRQELSTSWFRWSSIEVKHLYFCYEDREPQVQVLENVDLSLVLGQRVALVGSSGSGKSTLLRLLHGLHEPASGFLHIDGVAQLDFSGLPQVSTLILQDAELFENTLRYNISFGADVPDEELQISIEMACLSPVIDSLPEGLDTDIGERGINLSGGQKQRVALARGLFAARHSSLLLLDEPTSSLDPVTEAKVFRGIFAGLPTTCLIAAVHRVHLLDVFDYIYVMEQGKVVEQGTLSDLLALNGPLARLWQAQKKDEERQLGLAIKDEAGWASSGSY